MKLDLQNWQGAGAAADVIGLIHAEAGNDECLGPLNNSGHNASVISRKYDDGVKIAWLMAFVDGEVCIFFDGIQTYGEAALLVLDFSTGKVLIADDGISPYIRSLVGTPLALYRNLGPTGGAVRIAGHSMGGAAADFLAHYLADNGQREVQLLSLAAPRYAERRRAKLPHLSRTRMFFPDDAIAGCVPHPDESPTLVSPFGPFAAFCASRATHTFDGFALMPDGSTIKGDSPWAFNPRLITPGGTEAGLIRAMVGGSHAVYRYRDWLYARVSNPSTADFDPKAEFLTNVVKPYVPDIGLIEMSATSTIELLPSQQRVEVMRRLSAVLKAREMATVLGTIIKARTQKSGLTGNRTWEAIAMGLTLAYGPRKSSVSGVAKSWNKLMRSLLNEGVSVWVSSFTNAFTNACTIASTPAGGTKPEMILAGD